jgi:hypothetical protein
MKHEAGVRSNLDDNPAVRKAFWDNGASSPFANTLYQSWGGGQAPPIIYRVKESIVSILVGEMIFDPYINDVDEDKADFDAAWKGLSGTYAHLPIQILWWIQSLWWTGHSVSGNVVSGV